MRNEEIAVMCAYSFIIFMFFHFNFFFKILILICEQRPKSRSQTSNVKPSPQSNVLCFMVTKPLESKRYT